VVLVKVSVLIWVRGTWEKAWLAKKSMASNPETAIDFGARRLFSRVTLGKGVLRNF
jgi:hypothetical protein